MIPRKPSFLVPHSCWAGCVWWASFSAPTLAAALLSTTSESSSRPVGSLSDKELGSSTWKCFWQLLLFPGHDKSDIFIQSRNRCQKLMWKVINDTPSCRRIAAYISSSCGLYNTVVIVVIISHQTSRGEGHTPPSAGLKCGVFHALPCIQLVHSQANTLALIKYRLAPLCAEYHCISSNTAYRTEGQMVLCRHTECAEHSSQLSTWKWSMKRWIDLTKVDGIIVSITSNFEVFMYLIVKISACPAIRSHRL